MSVYDDLVTWSVGRPLWQRDALRRLAQGGELTQDDLTDLCDIALRAVGAPAAERPTEPFAATHVPTALGVDATVALTAIAEPTNVNALAPGSRLDFEPAGLTIVYGDNGSGKSGYVRILKRVCRARSIPARILPNVLQRDPSPISAEIDYTVDGVSHTRTWHVEDQLLDELGSISVFDRDCAAVYVGEENEIAYRPLGLDLLDSLAGAAREIRVRLERVASSAVLTCPSPPANALGARTLDGVWPINTGTTNPAVAALADWTDESERALREVERALATPSPGEAAAGLRARQTLLQRASAIANGIDVDLGAAAVIPEARARLGDIERGLEEAGRLGAHPTELPGVGTPVWRSLWVAAAQYSTELAYADHEFPFVGDDARCVLCGQLLDVDAKARFRRLAEAVVADLEEAAVSTRTELTLLEASLMRLRDATTPNEVARELGSVDGEAGTRLREAIELGSRWAATPPDGGEAAEAAQHREVVTGAAAWLQGRAQQLQAQADLLVRAAVPVEAAILESEARELRAGAWIASNLDRLAADIGALRLREGVTRALGDCETHSITAESGRLTERYVTEALRQAFADELRGLSADRVRVRIVPRGQYGAVFHRLELDGAVVDDARVADVVSEGEFRAIALASFFAELGQADSHSSIVLDDPVSSLDHLNRERVAQRIVQEAGQRQVVVFTHDLVFLHDLTTSAEAADVALAYRRLRLTPTHSGWAIPEPPWLGMKVRQRVDSLQQELNRIRTVYEAGDIESYERDGRAWYGSLRETWERAVEEVMFVDAISRYRHEVKTNNLTTERVWLIEEADVATLTAGMTRSSAWLRGHDQPAAVNRALPPPEELRVDLAALTDWLASLRNRRRP